LYRWTGGLAVLIVVTTGACLILLAIATRRSLVARPAPFRDAKDQEEFDQFDLVAGAVFLALMLAALAWTFAAAMVHLCPSCSAVTSYGGQIDAGHLLRNVSPSALALPFLVLFCEEVAGRLGLRSWIKIPRVQSALVGVGVLVAALGLGQHVAYRQAFIRRHETRIARTRDAFQAMAPPGTRIAFWDGSPNDLLGDVSFHFWGNYRYGDSAFTEELLRQYPRYTYVRLREVGALLGGGLPGVAAASEPGSGQPSGILRTLLHLASRAWHSLPWPHLVRPTVAVHAPELIQGEASGVKVGLIAIPEVEFMIECPGRSLDDLFSLVRSRIGTPTLRRETIDEVAWLLITVAPPYSGQILYP
jgi:hypothetical protein